MIHIVLVEPEIPPNTGNIIRLCANTGAQLHLVKPLGFPLDDRKMRRAGLDYHEFANIQVYENWDDFKNRSAISFQFAFAMTTKGSGHFFEQAFPTVVWLVYGAETRGLSEEIRQDFLPQNRVRLPMKADSRSLNLSNSVAIGVYEVWRQQGFSGTK